MKTLARIWLLCVCLGLLSLIGLAFYHDEFVRFFTMVCVIIGLTIGSVIILLEDY